ncbi:MAG TPA: hypothetical protein VFA92_14160 [Candidatus Binatia bacterium]|nr:hypothetical protein [Candidatus Binatia bacterium]
MDSVLFDPVGSTSTAQQTLAPRRVKELQGRTVGLLLNGKDNADHLLDGIGDLLRERYQIGEVVRERKPSASRPVPDDQAKQMAERCDVVVTAIGD